MRFAIISDVHGNYLALLKVIGDALENNVDKFIFLGDYIFDLPFSNEAARAIMGMENAYSVAGNKETLLRELIEGKHDIHDSNQMGAVYRTFLGLPEDIRDYLAGLPEELYIPLGSGDLIYATHYLKGFRQQAKTSSGSSYYYHKKMLEAPFSHEKYLKEFSEMLKNDEWRGQVCEINARVILIGHNHLQGYGYCGGKLIINPGSCGQPLDFNTKAPYTILEEADGQLTVTERRIEYDIESVINASRDSSIYEKSKIWRDLCFAAMRTGRDYFGFMFENAQAIADGKGENGQFFSNETWEEAFEALKTQYII